MKIQGVFTLVILNIRIVLPARGINASLTIQGRNILVTEGVMKEQKKPLDQVNRKQAHYWF